MTQQNSGVTRRGILTAAGAAALGVQSGVKAAAPLKGRIKQSIVQWCFSKHWDMENTCQVAKELGCVSVELIAPEHWPLLKKYGLTCAIAGAHGFVQGMNNPKHQPECIDKITKAIDASADFGCPNVISFAGFAEGLDREEGAKNCVEAFKRVIGHAEEKKVNICLEMLNSRVDVQMKGHPGYQGDHTDYCVDIIKAVGSQRM